MEKRKVSPRGTRWSSVASTRVQWIRANTTGSPLPSLFVCACLLLLLPSIHLLVWLTTTSVTSRRRDAVILQSTRFSLFTDRQSIDGRFAWVQWSPLPFPLTPPSFQYSPPRVGVGIRSWVCDSIPATIIAQPPQTNIQTPPGERVWEFGAALASDCVTWSVLRFRRFGCYYCSLYAGFQVCTKNYAAVDLKRWQWPWQWSLEGRREAN